MSPEKAVERANSLFSKREFAEAERVCRQGLEETPDNPILLGLLGRAALMQNSFGEATKVYKRLSQIQPGNSAWFFLAANALQGLGELEEAADYVSQAISIDETIAQSHAKLGQIRLLQGRPDEAIPPLQRAVELDPNFLPGQIYLANAYSDTGQMVDAENVLAKASTLAPDNVDVLQTRARVAQGEGKFEEAISVYERLIRLQPRSAVPYVGIVYSQKIDEDQRPLIQEMEKLALHEHLPPGDRSRLFFALGKSFDDLGDYETATRYFDHANEVALQTRAPFDRSVYRETLDRITELCGGREPKFSEEPARPIFIVGMIRSGTTLTEQILGAHPLIEAGGELRFWVDSVGQLLHEPSPEAFERRVEGELRPRYELLMDKISPTGKRVSDKMPINYQVLGVILKAFPNARIVHCRRNPIDNCLSIYTTPFTRAPEFAFNREDIVFAYREYERLMDHWRKAFPGAAILDLQYEHLILEPEATIRELVRFVGLEWDERCLQARDARGSVNTPSQWQVRQPIYSTSVHRWRRYEPYLKSFAGL